MADKVFNIKFNVDANIGPMKSALDGIRSAFDKLKLPDNLGKNFSSVFSKLENEVRNFEAITGKGTFQNMGEINKAEKSYEKITTLFSRLQQEASHIKGIDPNKLLPSQVLEKTKELQKAWLEVQATMNKSSNASAELEKVNGSLQKQSQKLAELKASYESYVNAKNNEISRKDSLNNELKQLEKEREEYQALMRILEQEGNKKSVDYGAFSAKNSELSKRIADITRQIANSDTAISNYGKKITDLGANIAGTEAKIEGFRNDIEQLTLAATQAPQGLERVKKILSELTGVKIDKIPDDIGKISQMIGSLHSEQLKN